MRLARSTAVLFAVVATTAVAQDRKPLESITQHTGRFNGQDVRYTAVVAETFLRDSAGTAVASVVTTSYLREGVADRAARPVMFLFNGGPGASSTPLHFGAFGPVRNNTSASPPLVNNDDSILDAVDLVFIDPVGTGFSRPFPGVDGKRFWSRTTDAASVRTVIEEWIRKNGRERSRKYLCGESYGTTRAALILRNPGTLRFDGVLLFAIVGNAAGREMPLVTTFPTYATTAWFHDRVPKNGRTVAEVYNAAVDFARTEYVSALIRGSGITPAERHAVAQKMSQFTGLSVELIEANNLRVSKDTFMFNLLKDREVRTGQLDSRATQRFDAPRRRGPYDDPGMNYNPEAVASPSDTARATQQTPAQAYFANVLQFKSNETYTALNLDVNSAWNYEGMTDVNSALGDAMKRDPAMRLFWTGGYFDISTPLYGARYALDQAGVPGDRVTSAMFPAGHSVFVEAANRAALSRAVRAFVH